MKLRQPPASYLLTTNEAGTYLVISPATLVTQRSRGTSQVPFYRVMGRIFYRRSDLDALIESGRVVQQVGQR